MGFVKELFEQLGKATDILNVGRLIFYSAAGLLIIWPAYLIARSFSQAPSSVAAQIASATQAATQGYTPGLIFVYSLGAGFLVATVGFPIALDRLAAEIRREMAKDSSDPSQYSFPLNYPILKNKGDEDYAAWLISEYYRYVEIATYIPLGAIAGFALTGIYTLIVLIQRSALPGTPGVTALHFIFLAIVALLFVIRYWLWPECWVKRIVMPTIRTYLSAKQNLIIGVKSKPAKPA